MNGNKDTRLYIPLSDMLFNIILNLCFGLPNSHIQRVSATVLHVYDSYVLILCFLRTSRKATRHSAL